MTADLDLSPEAVERLANDLEHANEYEPLGHDGWTAAALLRALSAELAAARAKIEWRTMDSSPDYGRWFIVARMGERGWTARIAVREHAIIDHTGLPFEATYWLPLPEPPATDDETDAIRQAARRANIEVPE